METVDTKMIKEDAHYIRTSWKLNNENVWEKVGRHNKQEYINILIIDVCVCVCVA